MDNSNKWATGQQWVMKLYQQSIIIKSLKCTSSTGQMQSQPTSLCVSLRQPSPLWNSTAASHRFSGVPLAVWFVVTHTVARYHTHRHRHTSMFSLVCLIKVKDATFLSPEPRGTWPNLLAIQRSNTLMWLHHISILDDSLETILLISRARSAWQPLHELWKRTWGHGKVVRVSFYI